MTTLMVESEATSSAAEETAFAAMRRAIVRAKGFTLLLAVCNRHDRRERLMRRLSERLPSQLNAVTIDAECTDMLERVLATVGHDNRTPIAISGLDAGIDEYEFGHPRLASLNQRREDWRDLVPVPVIFWVPEYLLRPLAQGAPDFLDWRVGTFFFLDDPVVPTNVFRHLDQIEVWWLNAEQRQHRIGELRDLIQCYSTPSNENSSAIIRWQLELARQLVFIGEIDEAEQLVRDELLPACRASDDEDQLADAWNAFADIFQQRGQTDEALRIRREECTPRYERLGDMGSKAATMGKMADILQQRGQIDEALRIRREEQLPVYERLGDVREKAVTMGKIADILQQRGQTDEALRIYREEVIPVFERLVDVREKAVTMGKIADILQLRGQTDKALQIYREEELAVYERLGDVHSLVIARWKIALILFNRISNAEKNEAREHLLWAVAAAEKHQYAFAVQLRETVTRLLGGSV